MDTIIENGGQAPHLVRLKKLEASFAGHSPEDCPAAAAEAKKDAQPDERAAAAPEADAYPGRRLRPGNVDSGG